MEMIIMKIMHNFAHTIHGNAIISLVVWGLVLSSRSDSDLITVLIDS